MARLTEEKLQALTRTAAADIEERKETKSIVMAMGDGSGLSFCISKAGTASWKLRYRYAGKARWYSIGRYPHINLKEAAKRARKARVKLDEGVDPIAEK